jgi:hypothetical protein
MAYHLYTTCTTSVMCTQLHQRDVWMHLTKLHRERKLTDVTDFQWLRQTRYYWRYTTGMYTPSSVTSLHRRSAVCVLPSSLACNHRRT